MVRAKDLLRTLRGLGCEEVRQKAPTSSFVAENARLSCQSTAARTSRPGLSGPSNDSWSHASARGGSGAAEPGGASNEAGRTMRTSYTVRYERDETGWWVAQVKEAPAAITQGRTISEARRRIREALALALDDDAAARRVKLIDDVRLPADARRALEQARAARARLANESKKAQASTAKAVRTLLKSMHLSVRDAGDLIGISPQRVHQLAHENG